MAGCEAALRPAWDAIASGAHKAPSPNPAHGRLAYLRSFTAGWVYTVMATTGVSLLERQRKYAEATDMLRQLLGAGHDDVTCFREGGDNCLYAKSI